MTDHRRESPRTFDLPGQDPSAARVFAEFRRAMQLHRQLMLRALGARRTPPGEAMCLHAIAANDGATQREIGDLLHLSPPTVTTILKRMERAGIVARAADPDDQRVTRVRLTAAGRELHGELGRVLASRVGQILVEMPEGDRVDLARLLGGLADRMAAALEDAEPAEPADRPAAERAPAAPRTTTAGRARAGSRPTSPVTEGTRGPASPSRGVAPAGVGR